MYHLTYTSHSTATPKNQSLRAFSWLTHSATLIGVEFFVVQIHACNSQEVDFPSGPADLSKNISPFMVDTGVFKCACWVLLSRSPVGHQRGMRALPPSTSSLCPLPTAQRTCVFRVLRRRSTPGGAMRARDLLAAAGLLPAVNGAYTSQNNETAAFRVSGLVERFTGPFDVDAADNVRPAFSSFFFRSAFRQRALGKGPCPAPFSHPSLCGPEPFCLRKTGVWADGRPQRWRGIR